MDCEQLNTLFKESEQQVSKSLITKKFKVANAYWGKVPTGGMFPKNSGVSIRKNRLSAIGFGHMDVGWTPIEDTLCVTELCDEPDLDHLPQGGYESIYFGPERFGLDSDWICLESLPYREMPEKEIAKLEDHMHRSSQYYWEEYLRSRYIDMCENKIVALVPSTYLTDDTCDPFAKGCNFDVRTGGFVWERRTNGQVDERYVRVNVPPGQIARISELSLDMLDMFTQELEYEDTNMPFISEGFPLFDIVLGNNKMNIRFGEVENSLMDKASSYGGFDPQILMRTMGTKRVWRDRYSTRFDNFSARFYPDTEFNTNTLPDSGPYNPANYLTWPRFKRVFPTIMQAITNGAGIKHVKNPAYIYAPFVISTVFTPMVMNILTLPDAQSFGSAKIGERNKNYAGTAVWNNPDWKCNKDRNKGYWRMRFGASIEPNYPEYGYAVFHRVDHRITLYTPDCSIPEAPCVNELSPFCYTGMTGTQEDADLNGTRGQNRAVGLPTGAF